MTHYLTAAEYAQLMRVAVETVRRNCVRGNIDGAVKVGKVWRIPRPAEGTGVNPSTISAPTEKERQQAIPKAVAAVRTLARGVAEGQERR